ncbi:MAG: hypothetical protein R3F17_03515 [Planctomycetota bacterium]
MQLRFPLALLALIALTLPALATGHGPEPVRVVQNGQPAPSRDQIPKPWQVRLGRLELDLAEGVESKKQHEAIGALLASWVDRREYAERFRGTSGRKGEQAGEALTTARYIEQRLKALLHPRQAPWARVWMLGHVRDERAEAPERAAGLELLLAASVPDLDGLLLGFAEKGGHVLQKQCGEALSHRTAEAGDRLLFLRHVQKDASLDWSGLLRHRVADHGPLHESLHEDLSKHLAETLVSEDWRIASQALLLAKGLPPGPRLLVLVDALPTVMNLSRGRQRWRVLADLTRELRTIEAVARWATIRWRGRPTPRGTPRVDSPWRRRRRARRTRTATSPRWSSSASVACPTTWCS